MKLETFFEKFELFADAPDAVAKMRELVLALAVQGKLVVQDPSDEPASKLLDRIKKQSRTVHQPVPAEDQPYQAPKSWLWVRLGFLAEIERGGSPRPIKDYITDDPDGLNWIKIGDTEKGGKYITSTQEKIRKDGLKKTRKVYPGDFLLTNSMSFGRPYITKIEGCIHDGWLRIHPPPQITSDYLYSLLSSSFVYAFFSKAAAGAVVQNLNADKVRELPIPIPPLAEQKRIVAKVDELMALCDRLEVQQLEREDQASQLARASLARFADAPTPANLQFLFHPSYAIPPADLRKSILTLAVQGKLVPQDPNDEPAEELMARITTMRHKQKLKQYEPVSPDEGPYEVPSSWLWVRLGSISLASDSGWSPQCLPEARSGTDWGVLKVSAVSWGIFKPDENKALPPGMEGRPDCAVKAGDFLLSRANTEELVARSVVVVQTPPRLMMSDKIVRFTFPDEIERDFINLANTSDPSRAYYARNASGTSSSMKNIGREVMCNLPIPLPPLAEQRRIVAKVEQLMALVDALETQLAASRTTAENLLTSLVTELTSS
jgi:type I restriction enzyme S subunit